METIRTHRDGQTRPQLEQLQLIVQFYEWKPHARECNMWINYE